MKIAFLGAHGTGKTTLAHDLVVKLKKQGVDVGFLSEVARKCPFPLNEGATKKSQVWMLLNQIIIEMEEEDGCDTLVCDRSVLDYYCYYVNLFGRSAVLEGLVREHLKTYDRLIRVPIREGFLKKDKVRSVNEKFQKDVDLQFDRFIGEFGLKVSRVREGNLTDEEIVERVLGGL